MLNCSWGTCGSLGLSARALCCSPDPACQTLGQYTVVQIQEKEFWFCDKSFLCFAV